MDGGQRNPFHGIVGAISEWNRMRELGAGRVGHDIGPGDRRRDPATAWIPTTDIFAKDGALIVRVELAGVSRQDVDVVFSGGMLTVSGERGGEPDEAVASFYARERPRGPFRRSVNLPEGVEEDDISATLEDGLLEVTVLGAGGAVAPGPRPGSRRIEIRDRTASRRSGRVEPGRGSR